MKSIVELLRDRYKQGQRIRLISMKDNLAPLPGSIGTITGVDDIGTIHVNWDCGSSLGLIVGEDEFELLDKN